MNKMYYITTFILILLVSYIGITYSFSYTSEGNIVSFKIIGPSILYIDVNSPYEEYGVKAYVNDVDLSDKVVIDSSMVDTSKIGEYKVKYQVIRDNYNEYIYRIVRVIDGEKPLITLNGEEKVFVLLNGYYNEEGAKASDNLDGDLTSSIKIENNINLKKEGTYYVTYSVTDSNGNTSIIKREVNVKRSDVTLASMKGNDIIRRKYDYSKYSNTLIMNKFNNNGIYYEGYVKDNASLYKIKLKSTSSDLEYLYNMTIGKNNYYKGNLDLTTVKNGEYDVFIIGSSEERLLNKLDGLSRILRAKVGNKLISLSYQDDMVRINVDTFKYEYDIVIDPGHGGYDTGAGNGIILEKTMNLKQSLYEKCRYESMGLKVFMTRENDTYGTVLGDKSLVDLQRRALAIGYYGSVSRVVYSNHHNGSKDLDDHGFEIIVPNSSDVDDLVLEMSLYNKYKSFYNIYNGKRLYSKNYDNSIIYNKANGKVYDEEDYYAIIRIPYELFNIKTVIYEPIYVSNDDDFNWYWMKKNWIKVDEIKIEEYVNYLGKTYNPDNSQCLN